MNRLRRDDGARLFAIDLPTGLEGDSGKADRDCVAADCTITIALAKKGLVTDGALDFVGRLAVVELPELRAEALPRVARGLPARPAEIVATPVGLRDLLPRRKFDAYKNQFGRAGIVAGSKGFTGAALMATMGALRAGAGLVEVFVPEEIYEVVAGAAAPECMVKPVRSYEDLLGEKIDVWGI
jgi:NAD(P)H-hydrate epimerase